MPGVNTEAMNGHPKEISCQLSPGWCRLAAAAEFPRNISLLSLRARMEFHCGYVPGGSWHDRYLGQVDQIPSAIRHTASDNPATVAAPLKRI
jgi:hypothetical protein